VQRRSGKRTGYKTGRFSVGPDGWAEGWTGCGRWAGGPASSLFVSLCLSMK
jgi:hypothetical protein